MAWKLAVSFLLLALSMQVYTEEANPVIFWSNTNSFDRQKNSRKIEVSTAKGLKDLIWDPMSEAFQNTAIRPEIVVIFAENSLTSEESPLQSRTFDFKSNGGSFPNLKQIFGNSSSSIVLPYIPRAHSISIQTIAHLSNTISGNTFIVEDSDPTKTYIAEEKGVIISKLQALTDSKKISSMNSEQLLNNLRSQTWAPLNNEKIDIIVVGFQNQINSPSKLERDDAQIKTIIESIADVQYSAIFVTDVANTKTYTRSEIEDEASSHFRSIESSSHFRVRGDDSFWTDDATEGIILMIPFIGIVLLGIICGCGLQSDLKFDHEKNILKKQ